MLCCFYALPEQIAAAFVTVFLHSLCLVNFIVSKGIFFALNGKQANILFFLHPFNTFSSGRVFDIKSNLLLNGKEHEFTSAANTENYSHL